MHKFGFRIGLEFTNGDMDVKKIIFAISFMALAGCSGQSLNSVKTYNDNFDGTKIVSIVPHGAECCLSVGAFWSAKSPDAVILPVKLFGAYTNIQSADLNVDGKLYNLREAADSTSYTLNGSQMIPVGAPLLQESTRGFVAPLSLVKAILASGKTTIRVNTLSDGSVSSVIKDGTNQSKAFTALQEFIGAVDKAK